MPHDKSQSRALRAVIEEVKRSDPHAVDWESMEANLMREVRRQAPRTKRETWQPFAWFAVPLIGVALAFALWSRSENAAEHPTTPAPELAQSSELNGDAVGAEEVLHTTATPLVINHAGRATWTLTPGSSAKVLSSVGVLRIRLLSGALHAEVVPSAEPERFVVEAADTRVAVHGTVFDVVLRSDRTLVDVQQGVVAVGSVTRPSRASTLLHAHEHGEFDLNGAPLVSRAAAPERSARRVALRPPPPAALPSSEPAPEPAVATQEVEELTPAEPSSEASAEVAQVQEERPAPPLPFEPTIGEVEAGVSALIDGVSRCLKEKTNDAGNVRIIVRTSVTLEIAPDGSVSAATFSPPLSPGVHECSTEEAYAVRFPASIEGASVTRLLELSR